MTEAYRYLRPAEHIQYYSMGWEWQSSAPPAPAEQPRLVHDFVPVQADEELAFAPDAPDMRRFTVQTPQGNPIGTVTGYLADAASGVLPFCYVAIEDGRTVVVPTDQVLIYPEQRLVTLEGGKAALYPAPEATHAPEDAERALHYWAEYRRHNAA